jgi:hypothetical protein
MGLNLFDFDLPGWAGVAFWLAVLLAVIFLRELLKQSIRGVLDRLTAGGTRERTVGAGCLVCAAVLGYLTFDALQSARNGAREVSLSLAGVILLPLALIIGIIHLVLGPRTRSFMGTRDEPTFAAWVIGITALALGVMLYLGLRRTLQAQGYEFR